MQNLFNQMRCIAVSFFGVCCVNITSMIDLNFIDLKSVELIIKTLIEICIGIITIMRLLNSSGKNYSEQVPEDKNKIRKYKFWRRKK